MSQLFDDTPGPDGPAAIASDRAHQPLAARMRPALASEIVGQSHLLSPGSALAEALAGRALHSMILHGPPGTGKTTIARLIASAADAAFEEESAVAAGRAEVRAVIERARERRRASSRRTIFFLDEIHRFNKAQQDALLPAVEDGTLVLIGATTENPYFEVNSALLSRARVYELNELSEVEVEQLLRRALDAAEGLAGAARADDDAIAFIARRAGGDARTALGALETAAATAGAERPIDLATAEDALQRRAILYDKHADRHYDYASAFIKALRGSDPDAAVYYLAVMLEGGEDARFIARRMVILASEDVGNADPAALQVAVAVAHAVEHVGLPEARINLAQGATYLALAPKSNAAYRAIERASAAVRRDGAKAPPAYLRGAARADARDRHARAGGEAPPEREPYLCPHDLAAGVSGQRLLPEAVGPERFYEPSAHGHERELAERLAAIERLRAGPAEGAED